MLALQRILGRRHVRRPFLRHAFEQAGGFSQAGPSAVHGGSCPFVAPAAGKDRVLGTGQCERCTRALKSIAAIENPRVIAQILVHPEQERSAHWCAAT